MLFYDNCFKYFSLTESQNAIGAYYDYLGSSTTTAPSISYGMRLEGRGVSEPYGPIPTGTRFSYTWIVVNTGNVLGFLNPSLNGL